MRGVVVATKPKVDLGHLAPDLLSQGGAGRQVFGRGQSDEDNGLVGEITILALDFDQLCLGNFKLSLGGLNLVFQF
jgi:hypothetical protein